MGINRSFTSVYSTIIYKELYEKGKEKSCAGYRSCLNRIKKFEERWIEG